MKRNVLIFAFIIGLAISACGRKTVDFEISEDIDQHKEMQMKKIVLLLTAILAFSAVILYAQTAQTRLDNGKKLFDQKNYDGAIKELTEAIKLDPNMAETYAYRAIAYNMKYNYVLNLADANKAIQLNPRLALGYYARGNYYLDKEDYDRAIADFNEIIRLDPNNTEAYFKRGLVYLDKKDPDSEITDFTRVIRLIPNYKFAFFLRGNAYYNKKDVDSAITDYEAALRIDPDYTDARDHLEIAIRARGKRNAR